MFLNGPPQKKGVSPSVSSENGQMKPVKDAFSVNLSPSAPPMTNVLNVVEGLPVGALQIFWQVWAQKGSSPRVVSILKEGYNLPFKIKPPLTRVPLIRSRYANPLRNSYLTEALHSLLQKQAMEKVKVQTFLAFYNRLFIVRKPNHKWRPILDLSTLNWFFKVKTFKMETPESICLSLQQGELVTSLDVRDAYFHILISANSRKFLRFHYQDKTFQFQAILLGLYTSPMEFHHCREGGKTHGSGKKHPDASVPGRLVDPSKTQFNLFPGHPDTSGIVPGARLGSESQQIRGGAQTSVQLCGIPLRLGSRSSQTHPRDVGSSEFQNQFPPIQDQLFSEATYVPDRLAHTDGKTGFHVDVCI